MRIKIFATFLSLAAILWLSSCRTSTSTVEDNCCGGRITLTVHDSATNALLDGGSASLYDGDHLVAEKPMNDSGAVWDGLCPGDYHFTLSKDGYTSTVVQMDSIGCNATRSISHLLAPASQQSDSCCNGAVEVNVFDSSTHARLVGATVTLTDRTTNTVQTVTTTDASVHFTSLCNGSYLVQIVKDGYTSSSFDWSQTCNETQSYTRSLLAEHQSDSCCGGVDHLSVYDSSTGAALSGTTLAVWLDGTEIKPSITTNENNFELSHLCSGQYRITIDKDGYSEGVIEFSQGCNASLTLEKALVPTQQNGCDSASISLHVEDSVHNDVNIPGATVTVREDGSSNEPTTGYTTDGGNFNVYHLASGATYIVTIIKAGYNEQQIVVKVGDCRNYSETVLLGAH